MESSWEAPAWNKEAFSERGHGYVASVNQETLSHSPPGGQGSGLLQEGQYVQPGVETNSWRGRESLPPLTLETRAQSHHWVKSSSAGRQAHPDSPSCSRAPFLPVPRLQPRSLAAVGNVGSPPSSRMRGGSGRMGSLFQTQKFWGGRGAGGT